MRSEKEKEGDEENKEYTLPTISPLDLAQDRFVFVFVFWFDCETREKREREEKEKRRERKRELGKGIRKMKGKWKIMK